MHAKLEEIRGKIDEIDDAIADLLSERMKYAMEAKKEKKVAKRLLSDKHREKEVVDKWNERGGKRGLSEEMMQKIAEIIIEYTVKREEGTGMEE
jgi:chorismate mutase